MSSAGPRRPRILAIDDDEDKLVQVELYFDGEEFDLHTARSGSEALQLVGQHEYDLVLLDLVMPRMDGFEVCRRLKQNPRTAEIPVIFVTGKMREHEARLAAFEIGAVDFIQQPVRKADLLARVKVMLKIRGDHARLQEENMRLLTRLQHVERERERQAERIADFEALEVAEGGAWRAELLVRRDGVVVRADSRARELFGRDVVDRSWPVVAGAVAPELAGLAAVGSAFVDTEDGRTLRAERQPFDDDGVERIVLDDVTATRPLRERIAAGRVAAAGVSADGAGRDAAAREYRIPGMVGESPALDEISRRVDRLRNVRATVLVHGETGTGKELVARALHYGGRHKQTPFIPIHCGAISESLVESELFGYEKGAFTGAMTSKSGLFTAADTGTVFLDEIAETPADLQVKLLRVLQSGEVRPVGAAHARHVDVRIIAATNRDLRDLVDSGDFREDLFYRLDVATVRLPSLRERVDDIPRLVDHFIRRFNESRGREGQPVEGVSAGALDVLQRHPWPGNVRELENVVDRALSLGCGSVLDVDDLPASLRTGPRRTGVDRVGARRSDAARDVARSFQDEAKEAVRRRIVAALDAANGDRRRAMEQLGMSRSTFYRYLQKFGLTDAGRRRGRSGPADRGLDAEPE